MSEGEEHSVEPEALAEALAAEHAAVHGYEFLRGVAESAPRRDSAGEHARRHKALRDTLHAAAVDRGVEPEPARPSYPLPEERDQASLDAYATGLEETAARAYLWLAASDDAELRSTAARALQETTVRALRWGGALDALPGFEQA
ncbi:hypothetical protein BJF83_01025 [Nocardiopsis sp. CNR-923]|uniref:ferritin-like domain-containing protein n=1 Tax=Nocardiopsis sp. CNR-923 TaxID=1904965 RepID=UPI000965B606|nr:ferritin-like domain-containing protein [Nocardiopsis sp. CNR-923]OLT28109.1 hypothetical protein BJF83_01025 [Nocardiopsis sp. CNR-923]